MMPPELQTKSLIAFYFGNKVAKTPADEPEVVAEVSKRAYRDLSRTLHGIGSHSAAAELKKWVSGEINDFLTGISDVGDQNKFDQLHTEWCDRAVTRFGESPHPDPDRKFELHYGQAQKWLNMALKYLAVLGHHTVTKPYRFLHVPVDQIVYEEGVKIGVKRPPHDKAWSRLERDEYCEYQRNLRTVIKQKYGEGCCPIDWEAKVWIERAPMA